MTYEEVCAYVAAATLEKVSLFDEEGVEGWIWTHEDGDEYTVIGGWDEEPIHPLLEEFEHQTGC